MHITKIVLTASAVCIFAIFLPAQTNSGWTFKKEKDGIKEYNRTVDGVQELKLTTSLQTNLSAFVKLFHEVENYPVWGYKVLETRLIKRVSNTEMYYYTKLDFPWPLDDRDLVLHTTVTQHPTTKAVTIQSVAAPDYAPATKGVVRVREARTSWTILPGTNGWGYLEYCVKSTPEGNIPGWVVNMFIETGPRESLKGVRKYLKDDRFKEVKLDYIKD